MIEILENMRYPAVTLDADITKTIRQLEGGNVVVTILLIKRTVESEKQFLNFKFENHATFVKKDKSHFDSYFVNYNSENFVFSSHPKLKI